MTDPTPRQVLDTPMPDNDTEATTISGYLIALLATLWEEGSSFSGKRPFGNSGWQYDVYAALIKAGHIAGALDEDGYVDDVNVGEADDLIQSAIRSLGEAASR